MGLADMQGIMGTLELFVFLAVSTALCAATWAACRWWYGRKLEAAAQRLEKMDKARQFSAQQTVQARKQIEKLQHDLATQQRARAETDALRAREKNMRQLIDTPHAPDVPIRIRASDLPKPTLVNGFADTLPM